MKRFIFLFLLLPSLCFGQGLSDGTIGGEVPDQVSMMGCDAGITPAGLQCDAAGYLVLKPSTAATQLQDVMTVDDAADYAAGDVVDGLITFTATGTIKQAIIADEDAYGSQIELIFFASNPAASTFTDNDAYNPADADIGKICGRTTLVTVSDGSGNGTISSQGLNILCSDGSTTVLYAVPVAREAIGGGAGYSATDALTLTVYVE